MSSFPTAVGGLSGVTSIAAGAAHALALLSSGTVVAWGYNADGQLGNNSNLNSAIPVAIPGLGGVAGIAGGVSPPGTGVVDVTVTTPVGASPASVADKFAYLPPPAITKLTPTKGPAAGGTSVTITGTGFSSATAVSFGAVPAASFTVNSGVSITAVSSPPRTAGAVDISVSTPNGPSAATLHDLFKYESPIISALSPNAGSREGVTGVTVTGSGFAPGVGATVFKFRKTPAESVVCESTTSCVLITPPGKPGAFEVKATVGEINSKKTRRATRTPTTDAGRPIRPGRQPGTGTRGTASLSAQR